jgi:transposase-like protein
MEQENQQESAVCCPYCQSEEVKMLALFGEKLMTSKYRCERCSNYFEAIRWQ